MCIRDRTSSTDGVLHHTDSHSDADQVANAFIYEKRMCEQMLDDVMTDTDTVTFDRRCGAVLGWEPPYDGYGSR